MSTLDVVVGAQFGSEAKGHVVQRLTEQRLQTARGVEVIRVAGPNAGHTGYAPDGTAVALRQVPVAAVVDGPVVLRIAAGSEIDLPVLLDEIDLLTDMGLMYQKALFVDMQATMITDEHKNDETFASHHDLVAKIGSTGKGIGAARADRIMRKAKRLIDDPEAVAQLVAKPNVYMEVDYTRGPKSEATIIEGTQGYGLGLHAGYYPQCTSSDCRAVDFMAMAGVSPWEHDFTRVWAVARVFPIRVAGNSGPLKDETTWEALGLPEERTTVTKKVRRVGQPDWDLVRRAVDANGGPGVVRVALTMVDQILPHLRDVKFESGGTLPPELRALIATVELSTHAKVEMFTTGPNTASYR